MMVTVLVAMLVTVFMRVPAAAIGRMSINECAPRTFRRLQFFFQPLEDAVKAHVLSEIGEQERPRASHLARVAIHHFQRGADVRSQINFVDHQEIGSRDSRAALARDLPHQ